MGDLQHLTNSSNFKLYRCLKTSKNADKLGMVCKWEGSILDYPSHVRDNHKEEFKLIKKNTVLKLDSVTNTTEKDKGVLKFDKKLYLYEIQSDEKYFYFSLTQTENTSHQRFSLHFIQNNLPEYNISAPINMKLETIDLSFETRKNFTKIPRNKLHNYVDIYGRLQFKILLH